MPETIDPSVLAQHPPAVKVGGRRLSTSSKHPHRTHVAPETDPSLPEPESPSRLTSESPPVPFDDYPRPAGPGQATQENHNNEEPLEHHDRKHREYKGEAPLVQNKKREQAGGGKGEESTMPTRDYHGSGSGKSFGAGGRISQPAGKLGL